MPLARPGGSAPSPLVRRVRQTYNSAWRGTPRARTGESAQPDNGREFARASLMRARVVSGPGCTWGAEHQVHGLTAQLASDRGDAVFAWRYRAAGTTAARRRGLPVPGDTENGWHAPGENDHVGPAATHAVGRTPHALIRGNDHRNEPGADIETARLPFAGDCVDGETGHLARLVPVLGRREAERHGPGSAGQCRPRGGRMGRAAVRRRRRFRPRGRRGCSERTAPARVRGGRTGSSRVTGRSGVVC